MNGNYNPEPEGVGAAEPVEPTPVEAPVESGPRLSPYAENFLNTIPEDHRPVVSQYLPKWDAGFTKYSQEVQGRLKGYESLGDPETLRTAHQVYQQLLSNPAEIAEFLVNEGYYTPKQATAVANQIVADQQGQAAPEQPALPPAVEQQLAKLPQLERAVVAMHQQWEAQQQERQLQEATQLLNTEIDRALGQHKLPNDPDLRELIIRQVAAGADVDTATVTVANLIQRQVNQRATQPPPNVLSGSSLPGTVKPTTPEDRTAAIAQFLSRM